LETAPRIQERRHASDEHRAQPIVVNAPVKRAAFPERLVMTYLLLLRGIENKY
jgi:hypothetical protein